MISLNEANMAVLLSAITDYFGRADEKMFKTLKKMTDGETCSFREVPMTYLIKKVKNVDVTIQTIKKLHELGNREKFQIDGNVSIMDLVLDFVIFEKIDGEIIPTVIELQGDYHYGSINGSNLQSQIARDIAKENVLKSEQIEFHAFKMTRDCEFSPIAIFLKEKFAKQK